MGFKDKIIEKQAEKLMDKTGVALNKVLESIHAHLEAQLKVQREHYNYVREKEGDEPIDFEKQDKLQKV